MRADSSQEIGIPLDLERKAVTLGDPAFPDAPWIVHFLDLEGRMTRILKQESELLVCEGLDLFGKRFVVSVKGVGGENPHRKLSSSPPPCFPEMFDQFLSGRERA